jgi:hypothetical protein
MPVKKLLTGAFPERVRPLPFIALGFCEKQISEEIGRGTGAFY